MAFFLFSAAPQDLPRIEADPLYLSLSTPEKDLNPEEFIRISIYASGSDDPEYYINRMNQLIDSTLSTLTGRGSSYEKGEEILKYLHANLFSAYDEDQTEIDTVFRTGRFNCVSSAVIYMAAGRAAGLDMQGVRTSDHAFVSMKTGTDYIDVETTNIWGFDPGQKKEFIDSFSGSTGYNYVPPGNYRLRQNVSDRQMIGLILQNRIAALQRGNNHRDSVPLAIDRYVLTRSQEARKDMYDTFSNYASRLNGVGNYEKGIQFLLKAMAEWGASEKPLAALEALVHNHLLSLVDKGQSDEALEYLNNIESTNYLSSESVRTDTAMIYDRKTVDLINSGQDFYAIENFIGKIYEEGYLSNSKWSEYTVFNYIKEAERVSRDQGWLEAYLFVENAPEEIRNINKYIQLRNSCKNNYVVTVHNSFADSYNRGDYIEAENLIREGLNHIPDDKTLNSDLQLILRKKTD